jgi:hypothetical protein
MSDFTSEWENFSVETSVMAVYLVQNLPHSTETAPQFISEWETFPTERLQDVVEVAVESQSPPSDPTDSRFSYAKTY